MTKETQQETITVGQLIEHLRQWPDHIPVVAGEEYLVTENDVEWKRARFYSVDISTNAMGSIAPILLIGKELK